MKRMLLEHCLETNPYVVQAFQLLRKYYFDCSHQLWFLKALMAMIELDNLGKFTSRTCRRQ